MENEHKAAEAELAVLKLEITLSNITRILSQFFKWGSLFLIAKELSVVLIALSGKTTSVSFLLYVIIDLFKNLPGLDKILYGILILTILVCARVCAIRKRRIRELSAELKKLEQFIDPKRDSSQLRY